MLGKKSVYRVDAVANAVAANAHAAAAFGVTPEAQPAALGTAALGALAEAVLGLGESGAEARRAPGPPPEPRRGDVAEPRRCRERERSLGGLAERGR